MAQVKLMIQLNQYPDNSDMAICINIDRFMTIRATQPLDFPSINADPLTASVFCTSEHVRKSVVANRNELARFVADNAYKYVLDVLKANDTEMGYSRSESVSVPNTST